MGTLRRRLTVLIAAVFGLLVSISLTSQANASLLDPNVTIGGVVVCPGVTETPNKVLFVGHGQAPTATLHPTTPASPFATFDGAQVTNVPLSGETFTAYVRCQLAFGGFDDYQTSVDIYRPAFGKTWLVFLSKPVGSTAG
jgi:hypothetical protein